MKKSLAIFVGTEAAAALEKEGWNPNIFGLLLGASGGPKWLILCQLDKYLFGNFLKKNSQGFHSLGSSIGAWRHVCLAQSDPLAALKRLEHEYLYQQYSCKKPTEEEVTEVAAKILDKVLEGNTNEIVRNSEIETTICVARGTYQIDKKEKVKLAAMLGAAALSNSLNRKFLACFFERVLCYTKSNFSRIEINDSFTTESLRLSDENLKSTLLATAAIPFLMNPVSDIPNTSPGIYWDGGIIDYHFDISSLKHDGLILYPHFRYSMIPGWFDKALTWRHKSPDGRKKLVLLCPTAEFVASLPGKKIPDRTDFQNMTEDARIMAWEQVVQKSNALADEMQALVENSNPLNNVTIVT